MFARVDEARFIAGEHDMLRFWQDRDIFGKLKRKQQGKPKWSFLDGPITANNPMGVHHAWGRTYKDAYQRFFAMTGHELRYQNGFDCQGLWVEVEVEKQLQLGTKHAVQEFGVDRFVTACKQRVLRFAARQTEQSVRLGYWMEWDDPEALRNLAEHLEAGDEVTLRTPKGETVSGPAADLVARLGNPEWGGSYFTFSTENNETIWTFLKKCHQRGKIYRGHDVMPWSGRGGSAYSQMEVADGRKLTVHRSCFVRFPLKDRKDEYLLIWTTTPWTLTSNVAAMVNPDLEYVKVRTQRDGAVYYFAKENLNFKRMEKEFKEGFGRPEWSWPADVPKLKTLAQIFKEQGGYTEEGTLLGKEMIGWRYEGPFDDLPAQQLPGGYPEDPNLLDKSGVMCHAVVDGGRDSKGSAHVVAGEGTGIVHSAPGCGDIDHQIGQQLGLVSIAPLGEDGRYGDGFGAFSGLEAIAPETADLVFEKLKEKGLLVAVEQYPHIYPHCWRTGDELVFRLVDEWFINMDWRDEIKDVTKAINWVPDSVQGQERELEWLTTMRDWMISKKRFWGLALPIWADPDDPSDFEVIGSLAELEKRAVEGWDAFAGHTPHKPWIDAVKIKSEKTGKVLERIPDVGNPWLDAGITPFSTMGYREQPELWQRWYPADFVTECFPGQFRNWFYSLLALSTMMRYDETDSPEEKRPFKTLLGHRLVMNEQGRPMHKSDGTAIWFEEAAEQLGVDTLRWLYLQQNPASDLRFGTRHPDEPVTLPTVDGPIDATQEGLPTCKVSSTPADEVRRQVLIPLWNSYAFFVNYAVLDGFTPSLETVPPQDRPEIDRWLLSRLQELTHIAHESFTSFDVARFMQAAATFIDDLSNWYIRRNRRRFWRPQTEAVSATTAAWEADKLAAYQTLYEVLLSLTKLLAPCVPFLSERIYQNLTHGEDGAASGNAEIPESVHLCDYPRPDESLLDAALNGRMATAQNVVRMGHRLREESSVRVRQPLPELRFACATAEQTQEVAALAEVIADELNVKQITASENLDDLVKYQYKPNLKTLGPKYGKLLGAIRQQLPVMDSASLDPLRRGEAVSVTINDEPVTLQPEDVLVTTEQAGEWKSADEAGVQIALSTALTPELLREGAARDLIRHVQQQRKDADLAENDRIAVTLQMGSDDADTNNVEFLKTMLSEWSELITRETRAERIDAGGTAADARTVAVGSIDVSLSIIPL